VKKRPRHNVNASQSGARNKLGEDFIACLCADFESRGADAIRQLCEQNPRVFLQVAAGLVRKEHKPDTGKYDD
jgi:hypothetical protein